MNTKLIALADEMRDRPSVRFNPRFVYKDKHLNADNIAKAGAFVKGIWNCTFEPRPEQFAEDRAYLQRTAFTFSASLSVTFLTGLIKELVTQGTSNVGLLQAQAALLMVGGLGMAASYRKAADAVRSWYFYRTNQLLREQNDPVARLQIAEGGADYKRNLLMFEAGSAVPDIIVHEMVHLLKREGLTRANADRYLATAAGYHYAFVHQGPFLPLYNIGSHIAGDFFAARYFDHLMYGHTLDPDFPAVEYMRNIDRFNKGELTSEKECGYTTGVFLAAVINRLYDLGTPLHSLAKTFRLLGNGMGLLDSLEYSAGAFLRDKATDLTYYLRMA